MGQVTRECWRCDKCGYVWIKQNGVIPLQCPSSFCRTRKWNHKEREKTDFRRMSRHYAEAWQ
jgi:rubrerythrin